MAFDKGFAGDCIAQGMGEMAAPENMVSPCRRSC